MNLHYLFIIIDVDPTSVLLSVLIILSAMAGFIFCFVISVDNNSKIKYIPKKDQNRNNQNKKEYEDYYRRCILLSLGAVMKADGRLKSAELERVKSIINRYYQTENERENALKLFYSFLNDPKNDSPGFLFRKISRTLTYVAKREIIMELLSVAYADGIYDRREERMILDIISYMSIKQQEFDSIYNIFREKYDQGFYGESQSNNSQKNNSEKEKENEQNNERLNNAYLVLGVDHNISDEEIQKTYRSLAVKYHPDNFENLGDEAIRQATETMKLINIAYDEIKMSRGMK